MPEDTAREVPDSGNPPQTSTLDPPTLQSRLWVSVFLIVVSAILGRTGLSEGLGGAWFWVPAGIGASIGVVASIVQPLAPPDGRRISEARSWSRSGASAWRFPCR